MKAKIIAFSNLFPLPWEPRRATFNLQQFQHLSQQYDVQVMVPVAWTNYCQAKWKKTNEVQESIEFAGKVDYLPYLFIPKFARCSYGITQFFSMLPHLSQFMGKNRPQMIFATWVYPDAFTAILLGKLLKIPVIVKVHGSDINENARMSGVRSQVAYTLRQADAVLTVSQDLANKVIELGADKTRTRVIYNGVDLQKFIPRDKAQCREQLGLSSKAKIVLYVGNLKPAKGCVDLLHAFIDLCKKMPDVHLVYVGSGQCAEDIKRSAEAADIADKVKLAGSQAHDKLPIWMNAADLVTLPSHNEGVPNVLLEAMACGRTVVASKVGGIPEIVPELAGILVPRQQKQALTQALACAFSKTWDATSIRQHAEQFSWHRNTNECKQLFKLAEEKKHA